MTTVGRHASASSATRRRFVAPPREAVDAACFVHPLFDALAPFSRLLAGAEWPSIEMLNGVLPLQDKRLVEQDAALLADGRHYEQRIAETGSIATRASNWHDLFNALVWARHPAIKRALNTRQCLHIRQMGAHVRNRAQAALTQFDESGVIVRVRDARLLAAWNAHDWQALFVQGAGQWASGDIAVAAVIGHALMEQALLPTRLLVGKCLVVQGEDDAACIAAVALALDEGAVLQDPLELRPLPLAGIPGWHPRQDAGLYEQTAYFRPLRAGRGYPPPL
ncbi:DUF3025 domain-containing protein [Stenotrophomonas sp. Sa5BUN4]|uniref:DUF3025 domain-containing protein n=1 Tax=Stenotrophomonas lacuserhaii TaxID=2760084 RepID=A0A8X8FLJ3_9GAMM|nr:DUF3025 domain-containing protein [Stenotrophomonas pennii]MBD7954133.1 DUF3025 domain-containing protein [Stenotrophomonas pennii]